MQYQYDSKMQHKLLKFSKFLWSGFIIIVFSFSSKGLTCLLDLDFSFINLIRPLSIPWYSWCSGKLIYFPSLRHVSDVGHVQNRENNTQLKGHTMTFSLKITHTVATFLTKYSINLTCCLLANLFCQQTSLKLSVSEAWYISALGESVTAIRSCFHDKVYSNVGGQKSNNFHMRMVRNNESLEKFFK